ncbi:MAG: OmpA family protein [Deltaproteobacteria bacterium]|nr:OmpA family protein [Deltaproteobacteria bacterium]
MKKRNTTTFAVLAATALVFSACAHAPKPQELIDLEAMRSTKDYEAAKEKQPELSQASDSAHKKAFTAWEDEELDISKHYAQLATIKLRTALTLISQVQTNQRVVSARKEFATLQAEHGRLIAKIGEADEQIKLHGQLTAARKAAAVKEAAFKAKLTEAQQKQEQQKALAAAQKSIGDANLALKMADTVDASKNAKVVYQSAVMLLTRAQAALEAGNASEASTTAMLAKGKAKAAHEAARPKFLSAKKDSARQVRNQALQKAAAGIPGVTVKFKTVGQTQQLIIPVLNLFKRRRKQQTEIRDEKMVTLNAIGAVLNKFTEYPVVVTGHASHRVRSRQRYAISQTRAQVVANHFVSMGVKLKRMVVAGRGAEVLMASRRSRDNDRVEITLLFH